MTEICVHEPALLVITVAALLCGLVIGAVCTVWVLQIKHHESGRA